MRGWALVRLISGTTLGMATSERCTGVSRTEVACHCPRSDKILQVAGRTRDLTAPTRPSEPQRLGHSIFRAKGGSLSDERLHRCHRRRIAACPFVAGFSEGSTRRRVEKRCSKNVEVRAHLPPYSSSQA